MRNSTILALSLVAASALTGAASQAPSGVAGTWNISLQGHQIGLVLSQEDSKVTGTLMMNTDVPVDGTFAGGVLSLSGAVKEDRSGHLGGTVSVKARLNDDGTLTGDLATARGTIAFTAERLKRRRK